MMPMPLFNTDAPLWDQKRCAALQPGDPETKLAYLTLSDGHVIKHTIRMPECIGRFSSDAEAEQTLLLAQWIKRGEPFFPS
jgi:hypothetical protein